MTRDNLASYMALAWVPIIDTVTEEGQTYVRLTVPGLTDFAVYGDAVSDVQERFREALESHLAGYLAVGKCIPEPVEVDVQQGNANLTGSAATAVTRVKNDLVAA